MKSNLDFLWAAFFLICLVWFHYLSQKHAKDMKGKAFRTILAVAVLDICFEIITTYLMDSQSVSLVQVTRILHTLFYFLQAAVPYLILAYILSMRQVSKEVMKRAIFYSATPMFAIWAVIMVNHYTGCMFSYNAQAQFVKGPLYLMLYLYSIFYGLVAIITILSYRDQFEPRLRVTMIVFFIIEIISVGTQALNNDLLLTGFGLALGIMCMYMTSSHPLNEQDNLTRTFDSLQLAQVINENYEQKIRFFYIAIEVKNLSTINSLHGISCGDRILADLAMAIQTSLKRSDVYRSKGDRFVVLCDTLADFDACMSLLRQEFEGKQWEYEGTPVKCCIAICGIKTIDNLTTREAMEGYVDYLLSSLPSDNPFQMIHSDEYTIIGYFNQQTIENYLEQAVKDDLFEVYFQPLFDLKQNRFSSVEVLSRLRHPDLGWISPAMFIPMAEKNGLIGRLDQLQVVKVCRFMNEHPEFMDMVGTIKINLSPYEILRMEDVEKMLNLIEDSHVRMNLFEFEITETVATKYNKDTRNVMKMIQSKGMDICLDDFGSGYANLSAVMKLPFTTIKLDRSLIVPIEMDDEDKVSVRFYANIVNMFKSMDYNIVAEGIEKTATGSMLKELGVDYVQGFAYAKPMSMEDAMRFIKSYSTE